MKSFIVLVFTVCMAQPFFATAQSISPINVDSVGLTLNAVMTQMYINADPADTSEEGNSNTRIEFNRRFWQARTVRNDSSSFNMFQGYYTALLGAIAAKTGETCSGNWTCVGPDDLSVQGPGYINCIWADPADSNFILAGTWGGLFKTSNGGTTWTCITDNAPIAGGITYITWICVNPLDKNNIYLGTSAPARVVKPSGGASGVAILKTFDGGQTWQQEAIPIDNYFTDNIRETQKVFITPDGLRLYAFCTRRIFTRTNGSTPGSWVEITPANVSQHSKWYDLEFDPGNQNHFFVSNMNDDDAPQAGIWEASIAVPNPAGASPGDWTKITANLSDTLRDYYSFNNYDVPGGNDWIIFDISIPDADTLFAIGMDVHSFPSSNGSNIGGWAGLFKYNLAGTTHVWTRVNNRLPYYQNPSSSKFELAVSPAGTSFNHDRHNIYYGTDIAYQSFDNGESFHGLHDYYGANAHADIRGVYIQKATNSYHGKNDIVFFATDGGVSKKPSNSDVDILGISTLKDISGKGLACGHFWTVATSEEGGLLLAGMMHDGMFGYEPTQSPKWKQVKSGDTYTSMFDMEDRTKGYGLSGFGGIVREATNYNASISWIRDY